MCVFFCKIKNVICIFFFYMYIYFQIIYFCRADYFINKPTTQELISAENEHILRYLYELQKKSDAVIIEEFSGKSTSHSFNYILDSTFAILISIFYTDLLII